MSKKIKKTRKPINIWTKFQIDESTTLEVDKFEADKVTVYVNNKYVVIKREYPEVIHLSIRSMDRAARHDWREFQLIKNELIGEEEEAVELYPAESRLVDASNQYHLWCVKNYKWPIGFKERLIRTESNYMGKSQQRPFASYINQEKDKDEEIFDISKMEIK